MSEKKFVPDWTNKPPVPGSYRSIVKEGRQDQRQKAVHPPQF
mgnify:CR=1 FL=1